MLSKNKTFPTHVQKKYKMVDNDIKILFKLLDLQKAKHQMVPKEWKDKCPSLICKP